MHRKQPPYRRSGPCGLDEMPRDGGLFRLFMENDPVYPLLGRSRGIYQITCPLRCPGQSLALIFIG